MMTTTQPALSGLTLTELASVCKQYGLPSFTAKQIVKWLYQKQITAIDQMTDLSLKARQLLSSNYTLGRLPYAHKAVSTDGTIKYLFPTHDGHFVESVYIPDGDRATLCVSSQVGCKMGCKFCMTGRQGFDAQLTTSDILNQIYSLPDMNKLTNIVFMGQGEPFDNTDNVLKACDILTSDYGLGWSPKRITVSTVGITRGLKIFLEQSRCNLAISLHFPFNEERTEHMPINKAFSISDTLPSLRKYFPRIGEATTATTLSTSQRRLTFEYIVFKGLNDTLHHQNKLLALLKDLDCRLNLIPFHQIPDSPYQGAEIEKMKQIRDYLSGQGLFTTIRASRGQDIMAACGLLSTSKSLP